MPEALPVDGHEHYSQVIVDVVSLNTGHDADLTGIHRKHLLYRNHRTRSSAPNSIQGDRPMTVSKFSNYAALALAALPVVVILAAINASQVVSAAAL